MTNNEYELITKENNRRMYILANYYMSNNWLAEYDRYKDEYINYTSKLIKKISFTNARIRYSFLKDDTIPNGNYHISKSRLDYYNGYTQQLNNTSSIFNLLNNVDTTQDKVYFITVDYTISNQFFNVDSYLNKMKNIYKNLVHTSIYPDIKGLLIKYELAYSVYNGLLYYIPHSHILLKLSQSNSNDTLTALIIYLTKYIDNTKENSIKCLEITYNNSSYYNLAKYLSKDFYYYVFHYKDRANKLDSFIVPQPHIIALLYNTGSFRFFNSYKDFRFLQSK